VDTVGKLQLRRDVYNLDSRTLAAIKSERGIVAFVPERKQTHEMVSGSSPNRFAHPTRTSANPMFYEAPNHTRPTPD
jgi:hypothetical protein